MRISDWSSDVCSSDLSLAELARDWGDPVYWRDNSTVAAVSMVFSMPAGTDPDKVLSAVREVARSEIGHEWDYVLALHTDTPRPHVHVPVADRQSVVSGKGVALRVASGGGGHLK